MYVDHCIHWGTICAIFLSGRFINIIGLKLTVQPFPHSFLPGFVHNSFAAVPSGWASQRAFKAAQLSLTITLVHDWCVHLYSNVHCLLKEAHLLYFLAREAHMIYVLIRSVYCCQLCIHFLNCVLFLQPCIPAKQLHYFSCRQRNLGIKWQLINHFNT